MLCGHESTLLALALCAFAFASMASVLPVRAQDRPTSGDMSVSSGRTLGIRTSVLSAGIGWPGLWAQFDTGLSSRFTLGVRVTALYGSSIMGLGTGIGSEVGVPLRLHIYGHEDLDIALTLRPSVVFGQGALVGQLNTFANDFGFGLRAEAGVVLGMRLSQAVTFVLGVNGGPGYGSVPDAGQDRLLGTLRSNIGIEGLMSRDTMLFLLLEGGYGFARPTPSTNTSC
jgi:hypothetical protein